MQRFRNHCFACGIAALLALGAAAGRAAAAPPDASLRAILQDRIAAGQAVGLSVGVLEGGAERFVNAGLRETGKPAPVTEDTVFEIGSISKAFTGVLLAQLVAEGKLALDAKVRDLVPETVRVPSLDGREMTLRDLATHTAGLPRLAPGFVPKDTKNPYAAYTVADLWSGLAAVRLTAPPGTNEDYSNLGFMLLSHILVSASGTASFEALVAERMLRPLGMTASGVRVRGDNIAAAHGPRNEPVPWWDTPATMGGVGAIRSSARDMLRFAGANLHAAADSPYAFAQQVHWSGETQRGTREMGLAWQIRKTRSGRTLHWHNGGTGGSRSFIGFDRAAGTAVVVLSNGAQDVTALGMHLLDPDGAPLPPVKKTVTLDAAALDQLTGEYFQAGADQPALWIMRAGDRLMARTAGGQPQPLDAESATRFSSADNALVLERAGAGDPVAFQVTFAAGAAARTLTRRAPKSTVALAAAELKPLAGRYRTSGGMEFTVSVDGGNLVLAVGGSRGFRLDAESVLEFVARPLNARVAFVRDGSEMAAELHWTQLGATTVAKRAPG